MTKKLILAAGIIMVVSAGKTIAQSWNLTGNAGTNPNTQFVGTTDAKDFKIRTNNTVRVFVKSNGSVGIGTSTPSVKLEVIGTVKSNQLLVGTTTGATGFIASIGGKLIAEEVRVDLKGVWPDYVFSENHTLMPLDQLEQWVNDHKHLPGIPAAGEIKSSGIMLGEMQAKSMEKIEEAMLYILQLNKENHELKAQIDNLQKQVNELKK
ncbi:MAG TPA: bZIP transcription factor [Bacteroidia bacterium]|nr:bZIP transcription factor [Bacteroidia bacterium]